MAKKKETSDLIWYERANIKDRDSMLSTRINNLVTENDEILKTDPDQVPTSEHLIIKNNSSKASTKK